ncbi:hypothetical protein CDL12_12662 [Handroanthus impetiginosus]|uniref:Uncharacterized protein n=1 Tax=Handroanthus impetiginosus TaxID=429701 RepID=A0A2G9HB07_9LAMI|nr:hypothetical protein CDL12_12662 [Handroanthus impetiginosus]
MKFTNIMNWRKIQIFKWARMLVRRASAANLVTSIPRKSKARCGSSAARLFLWKFRSRWKQLISWQSSTTRYNYDAESYSKNFDNGGLDDCPSPLPPGTSLQF